MNRKFTAGLLLAVGIALIAAGALSHLYSGIEKRLTVVPGLKTIKSSPLPDSFIAALTDKGPFEPLNILVIGSDTREGQGTGYGSAEVITGARSDTVMLVHLNALRTEAAILSFPRDLWVAIPSCTNQYGRNVGGYETKFNAAFSLGGANCTIATVTEISGIPVHHVIVVDFKGFAAVVDALGGLNVCLNEAINDKDAKITLPAGEQTLTGVQALGLARARKTIGDGSDLSRISRQQAVVAKIAAQAKSQNILTDPIKLYNIGGSVASALTVDSGLSKLPALASIAWQIRNMGMGNVHFITVPNVRRGDGANVILDPANAPAVFAAILADQVPLNTTVHEVEPTTSPTVVPSASSSGVPGAVKPTATPKPTQSGICAKPIW